ncbi:Armadillo repeat-containing protein 4 [Blyttiomyces sp. JEL0837]|nr:Armadillo repeat-containing protein 4 [Blyttiomyces sp. JEL0837]
MGATLSARVQWAAGGGALPTPSYTDGTPSTATGLKTSVVNQDLFYELIHLVENLATQHPNEAKAEFRRPLQWTSSTLRPAHFAGSSHATVWNVVMGGGSKNTKASVSSVATRSDGSPIFQLEQVGSGTGESAVFVAKVSSFEYLNKVFKLADEMKLRELQDILQANPNPIGSIFGVNVQTTGAALMDMLDSYSSETDPKKREQNGRLQKLLIIINAYDLDLLAATVKNQQNEKSLDIHKVTQELQMLQSFCGKDPKYALVSIDFESDYTFANGLKAPPWRQIYGEICYIEVHCPDVDKFIVTATKEGYFVNKGYSADDKGNEKLNYDRESENYSTLIDLIKSRSEHFSSKIDKQDYLYHAESQGDATAPTSALTTDAAPSGHEAQHDHDNSDGEAEQEAMSARKEGKRAVNKKKSKSQAKPRNATEPSLKWRSLGLTLEDSNQKLQRKKKGAHSADKDAGRKGDTEGRSKRAGGRMQSAEEQEFTESDSETSSEEEVQEKRQENNELPAEYYQIQKLVKYLRAGNQTATIIAICSLRDFDLSNEFNQLAIRDVGGLDTLVNLLDTDDPKCKIGALKILKEISQNASQQFSFAVQIRSAISDLDGMQPLVELLRDSDDELKCLAAETIAHCAKNARNRRAVRKYGGIKKLVRLLRVRPGSKDENVAVSGALALATLSKSAKNKEAIQAAGSIPLLANLLESQNEALLIPVVGILQECASDENYRIAIRSSGMIRFLVENLASKNEELQTHCASAIFKCAEEDETRTLVRQYEGLHPLVNLLDNTANKELLVAATGAVWKCAQNLENVAAFNKFNTIKKLIGLMENQPEDVLVNVVGALGACAQTPDGRQAIREGGGITPLVNLLTGTNQALLVNVTTAVGACALDGECMVVIDRLDGVRLLWSLLKSPNPDVQSSAAWAISPCIEHAKDAGEMVRSFVGGLELIVSLLKSDHTEVLASVCAAIANIAKDEENLAVITDHGVVPMLAKLTNTRIDKLRKHLAEAIARCCHWADNCITMHEHGVVQLLLGMVGSSDPALQEAAAGTIGNIRRLALASEKAAMS